MDREQIARWVDGLAGAMCDFPFENDAETMVLRHTDTRRWFGVYLCVPRRFFSEAEGREFCLNLKCPPPLAQMLCQSYASVVPAYHMNKTHWITVRLHGDLPREEIEGLMRLSYEITKRCAKECQT